MKGSVTKYTITGSRRPRWRYRIDAGKDENGRRLQEGGGGFQREGDAIDAMRTHIEKIRARQQTLVAPQRTLGEWVQTWLDVYAVERCQPKTLERYRQLAAYLMKEANGDPSELAKIRVSALSHRDLEPALYALLKAKGKRREHVSARTVRHVSGLLNVALNKAFRLEMIPVNPMLRVELPTFEKKDVRSLTPQEIHGLRDACRGDWTFALVELALASGARRGELLALQWSDIDWESKTVRIAKSLEQTAAGLRVKSTKTKKPRRFRISQNAIVALQFQRDQQAENQRLFGANYQHNGLVFCEPDGRFHEPDLVSQVVIRRIRKAGIQDASFHTLRHSHASNLISRGVPLPAVSARLGHCDTNITARIYSHALPADDQRAADVWDALIDDSVQDDQAGGRETSMSRPCHGMQARAETDCQIENGKSVKSII